MAAALAFGLGVVFLIVGRAELFYENFFDPLAAVFVSDESKNGSILRLCGG